MNDALKMQISAFVDGELPENESELLIRRLSQDVVLRQQVAQYLEIGRMIRSDRTVPGIEDLRGRVSAALGEDAAEAEHGEAESAPRFLKPLAGVAVAASVAMLALFGLQQINTDTSIGEVETIAGSQDAADFPTEMPAEGLVSDELREMYRRHAISASDFGPNANVGRFVTLDVAENLVEVEPDAHLVKSDDDESQDDSETDPSAGSNSSN